MTRSFFPKVFDRLLLKLVLVIRLRVIVVYRRPYVIFNLVITGQDFSSLQIGRQVPCLGSKKTWGWKRRALLKQFLVGAPME